MKKMNNKGFSLVELIVVIAIMAILAVTLAPRLTQYVEKARMGSDQEVVNAFYTAARLAVLDEAIMEEVNDATTYADYVSDLAAGLSLGTVAEEDGLYDINGKEWELAETYTEYGNTKLMKEIRDVVGEFKLKSAKATEGTEISLTIVPTADALGYNVKVLLEYNDTDNTTYELSDDSVRP